MTNLPEDIATLYQKWINQSASVEEQQRLLLFLESHTAEMQLDPEMRQVWDLLNEQLLPQPSYSRQRIETILKTYPSVAQAVDDQRRVHFLKTAWFRYAAIVLLIAGTATYLYITSQPSFRRNPGVTKTHGAPQPQDISPGGNKAILTVDDKQINLSANKSGITVGNTITYSDGEQLADAGKMLTLTTPKGGQYQITLPDGSKAWLNAASSISFPATFPSGERSVQVSGEAYFEIKTDTKRPFKVNTFETREIQVLGTSFNVNAYKEEPLMKTTLLEGSIKVSINNQSQVLQPGQQAVINNTGNSHTLNITNKTDLQQVIAWKNGAFNFEGAKLPEVMRQVERWYDVTVVYEKGIPDIEFGGEIGRSIPLSGIITAFERMGVHCRVEGGRTLIVTH